MVTKISSSGFTWNQVHFITAWNSLLAFISFRGWSWYQSTCFVMRFVGISDFSRMLIRSPPARREETNVHLATSDVRNIYITWAHHTFLQFPSSLSTKQCKKPRIIVFYKKRQRAINSLLFSVSLMLHFTHNLGTSIDKRTMIGLVMLYYFFSSSFFLEATELYHNEMGKKLFISR